MKIKQITLGCNTKNYKELTKWAFVTLGPTLTYTTKSFKNLRKFLEANQCIDGNRLNHKNRHPIQDLPKPTEEENMYVRFIYGQLTIFNHTRVKVSGKLTLIQ